MIARTSRHLVTAASHDAPAAPQSGCGISFARIERNAVQPSLRRNFVAQSPSLVRSFNELPARLDGTHPEFRKRKGVQTMSICKHGMILLGAVCLSAVAANAADTARRKPAPPPPSPRVVATIFNWTGFYAGAFVGGAHGVWTVDFFRNNNHGHAEEGADGFAAGGWVGYNYQFANNFVIGAEGDFGYTGAQQTNNIFDNDTSLAKYGAFGSIRARIGYAFDRLLVFGTGGLAIANITNNIQKGRNAGEQVVWEDQVRTGFAIGTGLEYAFTNQIFGRAEYLYSNYGTVVLTNRDQNRAEFTNEIHLLRVGASYRF
jgi:outer membrane immunogenic protein